MKIAKMLLTTSIIAGTATVSAAQGRAFDDVDANNNGSLSLSELEAVFGKTAAAQIMARDDRNGDGSLSFAEIAASNDDESDDEDDQQSDEQSDEEDDQESDEQSDEDDDEDDSDEDDDEDDDE